MTTLTSSLRANEMRMKLIDHWFFSIARFMDFPGTGRYGSGSVVAPAGQLSTLSIKAHRRDTGFRHPDRRLAHPV